MFTGTNWLFMQARATNNIDFWRGFALVEICVNHIPNNALSRFAHGRFSWSDSAELFVFLAGWAFARRLTGTLRGWHDVAGFVAARFGKMYVGQIATAMSVLVLYLTAAWWMGAPNILVDNHAGMALAEPGPYALDVLALARQPRFVDILPLYIVLTLATPLIFALQRRSAAPLIAASALVYALSFPLRGLLPTSPETGRWFFDPLSWQAMFVIGFVVGRDKCLVERLSREKPYLQPIAAAIVAVSAICCVARLTPLGQPAPESLAYLFFGKSYLGLLPPVQFLALALVAARATRFITRFLPGTWAAFCLLGRNSLSVFCAGTVISAAGQIAHDAGLRGLGFDAAFSLAAILALARVARAREAMRNKAKRRAPLGAAHGAMAAGAAV